MKILVFNQFYFPEPFRFSEICEELVAQGHEVTVVTTFPNYPDGEIYDDYKNMTYCEEIINGVNVIRFKTIPRHKGSLYLGLSYLSYAFNVSTKIKKIGMIKNFDLIYVYQLSPVLMAIPAILFKKRFHVPLYLYCLDIWPESIRDVFPNEKALLFKLTKKLSKWIYSNADSIGVTSPSFSKYLHEVCDIEVGKIHYIPQHAQDIGNIYVHNKTDENINVFYMGNIGESQNVEIMVDAVDLLRNVEKFKFHVVGTGSCFSKLKSLVKERRLENKIIIHGRYPANEMKQFYQKADACLLILSSKNLIGLTIPGKLQGYMSAGKPVIASIAGDAVSIIKEANCGITAEADDAKALAAAYMEFINNFDKYRECGENGRRYFDCHFTLKKHVEHLIKQWNEIL